MKEFVKVYCDPCFYNATGHYKCIVEGDKEVVINNNGFESENTGETVIREWTTDQVNAIPGWNTKKLAGH